MSSFVGDSQISLIWCRRHLIVAIQLAVNCSTALYFARCCLLTDWNIRVGKQGYVFISTDFKKQCFDVSFLTPICVHNHFEAENF